MKSRTTTPAHLGNAMNADGKTETLADEPNPPAPEKSWGFDLLVDASSCNENIDSPDAIKQFFAKLIKLIGMRALSPIWVERIDESFGRGVTAIQAVDASSITMHTDDDKRSVYLDVFSCKEFDPHQVLDFVQEYFEPSRMAHEMIYRDAGLSAGSKH